MRSLRSALYLTHSLSFWAWTFGKTILVAGTQTAGTHLDSFFGSRSPKEVDPFMGDVHAIRSETHTRLTETRQQVEESLKYHGAQVSPHSRSRHRFQRWLLCTAGTFFFVSVRVNSLNIRWHLRLQASKGQKQGEVAGWLQFTVFYAICSSHGHHRFQEDLLVLGTPFQACFVLPARFCVLLLRFLSAPCSAP